MEASTGSEIAPLHEELAPSGAQVVAFVCDYSGITLPPSWKGIVGRHARAMLEEGIPVDIVNAACLLAVKRGRPEVAQYVAGDLLLAAAGEYMSRQEYEQKLALYIAEKGGRADLLREQRERREARLAEIARLRGGTS